MGTGAVPRDTLDAAMREAVGLARNGVGRVEPNPPVGAVVLDAAGRTIGRGFHRAYGDPHAEVAALADAGVAARGATLVVTLEPCAHTGGAKKTPPCVGAIVASGVRHVVAACPDPNPATAGRAAGALREAGIGYEESLGGADTAALLSRYARHLGSDVPWTMAKWAMSADGRVADASGGSRWITGPAARELVHDLRARVEAIVVGRGTAITDDPLLTSRDMRASARSATWRPALRVVLDASAVLPLSARMVTGARDVPTLVVCTARAAAARRRALETAGVEVAVVGDGLGAGVDVVAAFRYLRDRGVRRALLESGGRLTGAALRAGVVHQVLAFTAPVVLGGTGAPSPFAGDGWPIAAAPRLEAPRVTRLGDDGLLEGFWPARSASGG